MRTTQEYFNMTTEKLQEVRNEYGYTKEECLLLDESSNTQFYTDDQSSANGCQWLRQQGYSIYTRLKMTEGSYILHYNICRRKLLAE